MHEHFREAAIARMVQKAAEDELDKHPWIKWDHGGLYRFSASGRANLFVWTDCFCSNQDQGFFCHVEAVDFHISDILPVLPQNDVWLGIRMP